MFQKNDFLWYNNSMKKTISIIVLIALLVAGVMYFISQKPSVPKQEPIATSNPVPSTTTPRVQTSVQSTTTIIGKSVQGTDITAFHYGTGNTELLFVAGLHGGYGWNTSLGAYELIDYLTENPSAIPTNLKVTVIPVVNPDGLKKVTGETGRFTPPQVTKNQTTLVAGRFNANNVDINRNFDCQWQATGTWQNKAVSGGSAPFSEPESQAVKSYVESRDIKGAVVWFSSAGGVYSSSCAGPVSAETATLTRIYADASGYPGYATFEPYEVTGDMVNWFAKNNIPAISVLLTNHTDIEWTKNKAGIDAVLKYYAE
jgi:hypothetical protein